MAGETYGSQYYERYSRSLELQERAVEEIPEATSSNYRGKTSYAPFPMLYMERSDGATLVDVDGNEYIDLHCGVSSIITGHRPEEQIATIRDQLDRGPFFATTYELEYETAKLMNSLIPASDRTKFISTGTEAVMTAIRLARAYTGKEKVLKFEGMYHGHNDDMLVNVHAQPTDLGERRNPAKIPEAAGIPDAKMDAVEVIPWNDTELLAEKLQREGDEIAAVITEAVASNSGLIWPQRGYLKDLQELAQRHDVLFILDEVVTGFRMGLQGAQGYFDLEPDLAVYGKALTNGYPCAALTGRAEVMDFIKSEPGQATFMGTFSGNPLVVAAAKANLELLTDLGKSAYTDLYRRGELLTSGFRDILTDAGYDIFIPEFAGFFCLHFHDGETDPQMWTDYRTMKPHVDGELFSRFAAALIGRGVFVPPMPGRINLTHAHTDEHIVEILESTKAVAEELSKS